MRGVHALQPSDPAEIGGHVLLGRLGVGGMGVVYLGRSPGGALAALKVIRAEHAADPSFRARFRREAEATGRLTGRWLVPVTTADPDSREPWLATAFVPGLSLDRAVGVCGPLPEPTVRVLGARLAEALTEVHAAGLVHRDVKPGNILLALDGPRLIDFGIVRPEGVTALTASELIVGSPGFLSPEQAQARSGEVGPPSDLFSLGCVLAYAATGRRPFGSGTPAGVLYHTVHEEPELDGAPPELLPLLRSCLAKDPAARPTAAAVREELGAPRITDPRLLPDPWQAQPPRQDEEGDWLPAPLPGIIAEHSAAVLALPDPDRTPPGPPPGRDTTLPPAATRRSGLSRRQALGFGAAAIVAGVGVTATRFAGGAGRLPTYTIGVQADLSGERRALGRPQERGARLAVAHLNARENRPFDLRLAVRDDRGSADRAAEVARRFVEDRDVVAVLGPTGPAGLRKVVGLHEKASLPLVSVSCGMPALYTGGATPEFLQLRADRSVPRGFIDYLDFVRPGEHAAVIDDRAATGDQDWEMVEQIQVYVNAGGKVTVHEGPGDDGDFTPVAAAVRDGGAQTMIFVGASPRRAARCARALRQAGFTGECLAPEPVLRPELPGGGRPARLPFLDEAGEAAEDWVFTTTYTDPTRLPEAEDFCADYRRTYHGAPDAGPLAPFAVEAYDAVHLIAEALRPPEAGGPERGSTVRRLHAVTLDGLAKPLRFFGRPGSFDVVPGICLYRVTDGQARYLGRTGTVRAPE